MSKNNHKHNTKWPVWKIAAAVFPFAAGAAAVNIFFAGLMVQAVGLANVPPLTAIVAGLVLAPPLAYVTARWLKGLIIKAEDQ